MKTDHHILKCRDDQDPTVLQSQLDDQGRLEFKRLEGGSRSWLGDDDSLGREKIRSRLEPWLTALFQAEHLNLLIGSGLTQAVHSAATGRSLPTMEAIPFSAYSEEIAAASRVSADKANRAAGNFEDQVRTAADLLRGLHILASHASEYATARDQLASELDEKLRTFVSSVLAGERGILEADPEKRTDAMNLLVSFLMSFASRTGTRDRLQIFTTNYDRYLEAGADVAGLHLIDRFVGSLSPVFRSSRLDIDLHYNPPGIRGEPRFVEGVARFTKLHGSLDWLDRQGNIVRTAIPFGVSDIAPYLVSADTSGTTLGRQLMVYPNAAKDRETTSYPYVELFRDFAAATCRPNSVLVCYGYGFGDEHINRVVEDMLTIPSAHLVVISWDDPLGRIMNLYDRIGRSAQISLVIGQHLASLEALVKHYLPKPAIDRTTFRMAELLKSRWGTVSTTLPVEEDV